jgi:hypothetical protein
MFLLSTFRLADLNTFSDILIMGGEEFPGRLRNDGYLTMTKINFYTLPNINCNRLEEEGVLLEQDGDKVLAVVYEEASEACHDGVEIIRFPVYSEALGTIKAGGVILETAKDCRLDYFRGQLQASKDENAKLRTALAALCALQTA